MKFRMSTGVLAAVSIMLPLVSQAESTATIRGQNVIVRGQPSRFSPIITHLNKGDVVTVLDEVTLERPAAGDEANWLKIALPTNATVWVSAHFVDTNLNTVLPARLNVRSGPAERFPIVGTLARGQVITALAVKDAWIEIAPPTNAFAYVAASLVDAPRKTEPAAAVEPATPATNEVTAARIVPAETNEVAAATTLPATVDAAVPTPAVTNEPPSATVATNSDPSVVIEEAPKPRIVTREGIVSMMTSIQAPSYYRLESMENGRNMNYLRSASTNLSLFKYVGKHVLVTGEETLDARWKTKPVITIQRIQVIE